MESRFKNQRGDDIEGRPGPSEVSCCSANIPRRDSPNIKTLQKTPLLNLYPLTHLSGPQNTAQVRINGENSLALLDNGSTINTVTPEFVEARSLDVSLLSNLVDGTMGRNGFGGLFSQPLYYVVIRVQVEEMRGSEEDQVTLVIPDSTAFGS